MKILPTLAFAVATAALPASFAAAGDSYVLDEQHTWVQFGISHGGWADARGQFRSIKGTIDFDKGDVTQSSVQISIDASSVDTNHQDRDDHLRSPDFLNAEEFPEIEFNSTMITQTGENTAQVTGDMTIIGVTREVVLDVAWNSEAPLPWDASVIKSGFSATASINALDFGMNKVEEFGLGPAIDIIIEAEAIKQ